jgi:hypothetical protein
MIIVDPLKLKIDELLRLGQAQPLKMARVRYGSPKDFAILGGVIERMAGENEDGVIIDLMPFSRIGDPEVLVRRLAPVARQIPVTIFTLKNAILEVLERSLLAKLLQFAVFGSTGKVCEFRGSTKKNTGYTRIRKEIEGDHDLPTYRRRASHLRLCALLAEDAIVFPDKSRGIPKPHSNIVLLGAQRYLRMPNGMLVSAYIDFKSAVTNPEALSAVAYEVIYALYQGFRTDLDSKPCDVVVVPNNTALLVGAAVQAITDIPVCVIDQLGPIPSARVATTHESSHLEEQSRACLLVEVAATGGEIDRTVLHLASRHIRIVHVISCYNLEVGHSLLTESVKQTHLCRPKRELGYVYRSE